MTNNYLSYILCTVFISLSICSVCCKSLIASSPSFYVYEQKTRIQILQSLNEALKLNYSLWEIKKHRIKGLDSDKLFAKAIQKEQDIQDPEKNFLRAVHNLSFLDRMQQLIGSFEDTHLQIKSTQRRPFVFNGLELALVGSAVHVVGINEKLMAYGKSWALNKDKFNIPQLGDEIIALDGRPILTVIKELLPYERASSKAFAKLAAISSLTRRQYAYPQKNVSDWTLTSKSNGKAYQVRLPYYHSKHNRKDAQIYLAKVGIKSIEDLLTIWDPNKKKWKEQKLLGWTGFNPKKAPNDFFGTTYYRINNKTKKATSDPVLRFGLMAKGGRSFGLLQVFTFSESSVIGGSNAKPMDFFKPIIDGILFLKKANTPLVLDLRSNGGGHGSYPARFLEILTPSKQSYAPPTWMYRITPMVQQLFEARESPQLNLGTEGEHKKMFDLLHVARKKNVHYVGPFNRLPEIKAHKKVDGFNEKIVAFITPKCISACDIFSSLLKTSKRAKLLGTSTNGTGAGGRTEKPFDSLIWEDAFKVLQVYIPNSLFGRAEKITSNQFGLKTILKYDSENEPTIADVNYEYTLDDYLENSKDWFDKGITLLEPSIPTKKDKK